MQPERNLAVAAVVIAGALGFAWIRRGASTGNVDASPEVASPASASTDAAPPILDPCAILGSRSPLLVRWTPEERGSLDAAMREGIAVVSADDCHGVRLLPRCHARGRYGYAGILRKRYAVDLANEELLRINAPLAGAAALTDVGVASLHAEVAIVGERTTTRHLLGPAELSGECSGATHFVASAEIGVAVVGADGKSGALDACHDGKLEDHEPPAACGALVTIEINPIRELGDLVEFVKGYKDGKVPIGMCPASMVVSQQLCVTPPVDAPFLCAFGDAVGCREQCDRGDVNSCDVLAMMAWRGKGMPKDGALAAASYGKSCEHGDPIACANLGVMTFHGDGVAEDKIKAATLFEHACRLGAFDGCTNLALAHVAGAGVAEDKARASALFERACDAGSVDACGGLAKRLLDGGLGGRDTKRAVSILDELCEVDDAFGCSELGRLHILGEVVPSDHARAAKLFSRACSAGADDSCVMLGLLYRQADGVARDDVFATRLMQLACRHGYADGCHNLGIAYEHGKGIPADVKRAAELYDEACTAGQATSCLFLADFTEAGTGVTKDPKRANDLRLKACSLGEKRACPQ